MQQTTTEGCCWKLKSVGGVDDETPMDNMYSISALLSQSKQQPEQTLILLIILLLLHFMAKKDRMQSYAVG
jgi:hypothetical protein